jgi:predicted membrane-bound spermidine synthase
VTPTASPRAQLPLLTLSVFAAGMATLALEVSASRLLGSVYGTSNLVWANVIGLILIYLTAGYFIGGRWADRSPYPRVFYTLLAAAAFAAGLVPLVARPLLYWGGASFAALAFGAVLGSFLAVLVLFAVPVTLLGCVAPFAIRLALDDVRASGHVAGRLYAISTLGSIAGTFLPVLYLHGAIGTTATFLLFAGLLLLVAFAGLWRTAGARAVVTLIWMPLVLAAVAALLLAGPLKPAPPGTELIHERESTYNYIQVIRSDRCHWLLLNEGQGLHSVYCPDGRIETAGTWDYFLAAPYYNPPPYGPERVRSLAVVGLAGGTIPKTYTAVYGPIPMTGIEIDPAIVDVGREYFAMNEPNLRVVIEDGRYALAHDRERYSVVAVDAYRLPYIPWHLTTQEFFAEVRDHLTDNGVVAINVGRTATDRRLVDALAATLGTVFPSVHVVDVPETFNSILYATVQPTSPDNLAANLALLPRVDPAAPRPDAQALLRTVIRRASEHRRPTPAGGVIFTDDRAPVESMTNAIIVDFIVRGGFGGQ